MQSSNQLWEKLWRSFVLCYESEQIIHHIYKQTYLFACLPGAFFTLVIDWMLTNRSHLLRRPSNRNEFIEAITIKRRILLSVYKFITGAFTLTQNVNTLTDLPHKCVPLAYRFAFICMTTKTTSKQKHTPTATFSVYNLTKLDQNY